MDSDLSEDALRSLIANIPGGVYRCATTDGWPMFFISKAIEAVTGYPASDFLHNSVRTFASIIHPDDLAMVEEANAQSILNREPFEIEYRIQRADRSIGWIYEKGQGIFDDHGAVQWIDGVLFDITERKRTAELLKQAVQLDALVRAQAATIAELSAPLIPISRSVFVMPLIGSIDAARAEQIMSVLLGGIAQGRAATVIIDITGITLIDTHVAGALVNASKGARLLGTAIIFTGIRPEVAQTMVGLGVEFDGMITLSTLEQAIVVAMRQP